MTCTVCAELRYFTAFGGVIGTADQRAAFDVPEAHFVAGAAELVELDGRHVADDGQVLGRGAQVLAERQDIDVVRAEIAHHVEDFVGRSPRPSMRPDFVGVPGAIVLAYASMSSERS